MAIIVLPQRDSVGPEGTGTRTRKFTKFNFTKKRRGTIMAAITDAFRIGSDQRRCCCRVSTEAT
jgi:hypothetical protein